MSLLKRQDVVKIIHDAINKTADFEYKNGFCINEEDIRANIYCHVREKLKALKADNSWRVFLNLTAKTSNQHGAEAYKPDMSFLTLVGNDARVEIFVEIKHWPSEQQIKKDIHKLFELRKAFRKDDPWLIFSAIMGTDIDKSRISELERKMKALVDESSHLDVFLKPHIYSGHWNEKTQWDPWRQRLRQINSDL